MEWNIYLTISTLVLIVSGKQKVDIIQDINGKNVRDDEINYTVHPRPGMRVDSRYYTDESEFDDEMPDEQRLMRYLFRNYEKTVRPVKNASTPVEIRMGLTMAQIFDMDEKDQVLVTNVWLDQEWVDEFMIWDPTDFANITMLRIPCEKLWLPDIVLYNNAAEYTDGQMPARAMVRHDGNVFWPIPTKLQSSCKVDVTYFPFDEQRCKMKFGSWTYDGFQVNIINRTSEVDLSNYVNNGEWELLKIIIVRNVMYYACCPEPFPDVTFYIEIRRRTLYYMYNVIFPCIMMSALTLLVFCLPPDSGEKIALGITVLLAFSVFMLAVAENLPETSEFVPLISIYLTIVTSFCWVHGGEDSVQTWPSPWTNEKEVPAWLKDLLLRKLKTCIYLTIVMALTSMSVIMTVFVLNLHHRGPNKKEVPAWLKDLLLRKLKSCGIYLTIVMALTSMSVIMTVFVLNLHHRGPNKKEVPAWLKDLLLRKLAPVLCLHDLNIDPGRYYNNEERFIKNVSLKITLDNIQQALQNETQIDNNRAEPSATTVTVQEPFQNAVPQMTGNAVSQSGQHVQKPTMANNTPKTSSQVSNRHLEHVYPTVHLVNSTNKPSNESRESPQSQNRHSVIYHQTNSNASSVIYTSQPTPVSNSEQRRQKRRSHSNLSRTNEEILSSLKRILEKHEKEDRDYEIIQEWRRVAQCVDRILFFVFLVATLSSTIGILVLAPALQ